jgi:2-(1,2-epoxy-1,2-dihydrophenyl)acetyl-CoA isomerase
MIAENAPVLVDISGGVATITLNRPAVLNALNNAMATALASALVQLENDPAVRIIVIEGAGDGFMAGGDVGYFHRQLAENAETGGFKSIVTEMIDTAQRIALAISTIAKPVIASVHGACAGYGLSLMLACDLAVAADNAKFTLAYIHLGTTPDGGASFHLPRVVGRKRAAEIALLGDRFGAVEAERWGMVNRVVPVGELKAMTAKLAARLAAGPGLAYARTKTLLALADGNSLEQQLAAEKTAFADSAMTEDFATGVSAFIDKKPAVFKGQ